MTTYREQHELAAKAAGLTLTWKTGSCKGGEFEAAFVGDQPWRPQENDGDALRLANAAKIGFRPHRRWNRDLLRAVDQATASFNGVWHCVDVEDGDINTATRHAIFSAAVHLGEAML